jgi:hypothetical protein
MIKDPHAALKQCEASIFKGYLFWRVKNSRIKKESTVITCWKLLSMVYARLAEEYMNERVLYDIRNVHRPSLSPPLYTDSAIVDPAVSDSFVRPG